MLQLSRELVMPMDLWLGLTADIDGKFPAEYLREVKAIMEEVHEGVRQNLRQSISYNKRTYDVKARVHKYDVGDLVYRWNSARRKSRKLCPIFIRPYLVTEVISAALYRVQDRRKTMVFHHDKLKRCEDRNIPIWIRRKRQQLLKELGAATPQVDAIEAGIVEEESVKTLAELPFAGEALPSLENSDMDETLPYEHGAPVPADAQEPGTAAVGNSDMDITLPYAHGAPVVAPQDNAVDNQDPGGGQALPYRNPDQSVPADSSVQVGSSCNPVSEVTTRSGRLVKSRARLDL